MPDDTAALDALSVTAGIVSVMAHLVAPSRQASASAIRTACQRLEEVRLLPPPRLDWGAVTSNRWRKWAAIVRRQSAQVSRRYPSAKRYTLLLAFLKLTGVS